MWPSAEKNIASAKAFIGLGLIVVVIARASRRARTLCLPAARRSAPRARIGGVLLLGREGVLVIGVR